MRKSGPDWLQFAKLSSATASLCPNLADSGPICFLTNTKESKRTCYFFLRYRAGMSGVLLLLADLHVVEN